MTHEQASITHDMDARSFHSRPGRASLAISERRALLIGMDIGVLLTISIILSRTQHGPGTLLVIFVPAATAWLVIGQSSGIYDLSTAARFRPCFWAIARAASIMGACLLLLFFVSPYVASRSKLLAMTIAMPAAILAWRIVYLRFLGATHFQRRVLLIDSGSACQALIQALHENHGHGISVVGILERDISRIGSTVNGVKIIGTPAELLWVVAWREVEEVVLTGEQTDLDMLAGDLNRCYARGTAISLMPHLYEEVTGSFRWTIRDSIGWALCLYIGQAEASMR